VDVGTSVNHHTSPAACCLPEHVPAVWKRTRRVRSPALKH
jgi:hypothetical protein